MPHLPPVATFGKNSPALCGADDEHLAQILLGTLATDKELRGGAESDFDFLLIEHSPAFVRSLVTLTVAGYPPAAAVRSHAALALRLYLPMFWCDVDPETRLWLKLRLPVVLSEDSPREVRVPVLLAVASVAIALSVNGHRESMTYDLDHNGLKVKEKLMFEKAWPQFSAKLFDNLVSGTSHELRNALEVVSMLTESDNNCGEVVSTFFKHAAAFMTGLERGLVDCLPESRMAAACCAIYVLDLIGISDLIPLQSLSTRLLNVLVAFIEEDQIDFALTFVELIVDHHTGYWTNDLANLGQVLLRLITLPEVHEDGDRRRLYLSAVEASLTMFEEHYRDDLEPCMSLCPLLFNIYTEGLMDADNTDEFVEAKCSLHRFATALGGVDITDLARQCLGPYILSSSWQHRHAGVCAIAEILEASVGAFQDDSVFIVDCVTHLQQRDPHPRVRSAAALTLQKLTGAASG